MGSGVIGVGLAAVMLLLLAFGIVNVLQVGVSEAQSLSSLLTSLEGRGLCRAVAEGRWRTERAQNLLGGPHHRRAAAGSSKSHRALWLPSSEAAS